LAFGGVMITYASFLHRKSDLNNNAAIIALSDFTTSFVAGLAVFATLGGMAFVTAQHGEAVAVQKVVEGGVGLAFVAFPYALAQLPYSAWFSFVFFFALVTLGIDSAFSITESVLAAIVDKTGWRRSIVLPGISMVGLVIGIVYITQGGLTWLGVVGDFIDGTWGIAFLGLLECLVLGWLWRVGWLRRHANERSDWRLGKWWNYLIRIFIPVILSSLFFWSLFDDLTQEGGFLRDPDGDWILTNCVGMSAMILVPIAAVLISFVRDRSGAEQQNKPEPAFQTAGRFGGTVALVLAVASAALIAILFRLAVLDRSEKLLLWAALPLAVVAIIISNRLLDKHNSSTTQASWFARWAGLLGTVDVGGFVALSLIYSTRAKEITEAAPLPQEHAQLSTISYIILVIVFSLIICGLWWCFYRALSAANRDTGIQHPDEVGDEGQEG
jgi:NSS family neurotransmitter:Na+ symporter